MCKVKYDRCRISAKYSGERQPQILNNLDILDVLLCIMNIKVQYVHSATKELVAQYLAIFLFCHMLKKTFVTLQSMKIYLKFTSLIIYIILHDLRIPFPQVY